VGVPETFEACTRMVRPGGSVANAGVHGKPVDLALQDLWIMDLSITMGLVSTSTTPMLLRLVAQHKLAAERFATHHFSLGEMMDAYDTFGRAAETKALKVVISR
jgi:alcohol dehydrogenase